MSSLGIYIFNHFATSLLRHIFRLLQDLSFYHLGILPSAQSTIRLYMELLLEAQVCVFISIPWVPAVLKG
jgi:hypothetical protein